jgi:hypothetical protein
MGAARRSAHLPVLVHAGTHHLVDGALGPRDRDRLASLGALATVDQRTLVGLALHLFNPNCPESKKEHAMTLDEQRRLAGSLDSHVLMLRSYCHDGMVLFNALSDRLPDLKALKEAAGPSGMETFARRFPSLGIFAELLAGLPRGVSNPTFIPPKPGSGQSQESTRNAALLPFRLQRAAAILAHTDDPDAADAQSACREVGARIVSLEDALHAVLSGKEGAMEQARRAIAIDWT